MVFEFQMKINNLFFESCPMLSPVNTIGLKFVQVCWGSVTPVVLRSTGKAIGEHGIKWGGKTVPGLRLC